MFLEVFFLLGKEEMGMKVPHNFVFGIVPESPRHVPGINPHPR